jgi:hypothetical protein
MIDSFVAAMSELKEEIDRFFYVNLFLMMVNVDKNNMTATEVAERQQEKIMMMGPALHRLDDELLSPTLEILFSIMEDNMILPPPPEEIMGLPLKIEYTSILAQAQRAIGITKIERVIGFAGGIAPIVPEVIDLIDIDETMRLVNDLEGAPAKVIRTREMVNSIREERARQQALQQNIAAANSASDTTKKLAGSDMSTDNALTRMSGGIQGER